MDKKIKYYHALCNTLGIEEEERRDRLRHLYGVESSKQLSVSDLSREINLLKVQADAQRGRNLEAHRRRVMAVIGEWLRLQHKDESAAHIQAIACRAAGCKQFNSIPQQRLISLYNAFLNKNRDLHAVEQLSSTQPIILSTEKVVNNNQIN